MKFNDLTSLLEQERVPTIHKLGYNSPEQLTQYRKHPYNSTSMDGGDRTQYHPENEETFGYNSGDILTFLDSGSNNGFFSLRTKKLYWPENTREQKLTMGAHGPILSSIAYKYHTDENIIVKKLELVKLKKIQNTLVVEPTFRQLSGFDEEIILSNLDTPDSIVKFGQNVDLPKPNFELIRQMYGHHFGD
jgi:hypothetical protein